MEGVASCNLGFGCSCRCQKYWNGISCEEAFLLGTVSYGKSVFVRCPHVLVNNNSFSLVELYSHAFSQIGVWPCAHSKNYKVGRNFFAIVQKQSLDFSVSDKFCDLPSGSEHYSHIGHQILDL